MFVEVAEDAGYCFGVERAISLATETIDRHKAAYSLGPLIHNPQVVEDLEGKGLKIVVDPSEVPAGSVVVIRSHGVAPSVIAALKERGVTVVDATCPFVRKAQQHARSLSEHGYEVVIVGERDHPEVKALTAYAGSAVIVGSAIEAAKLPHATQRGVVFQTTLSEQVIEEVSGPIVGRTVEVRFYNTVCEATEKRQQMAREIAKRRDVILVVGGKNSANTTRLFEICRSINPRTRHIETAEELDESWFDNAESVGITAGASTPDRLILEVAEKVREVGEG